MEYTEIFEFFDSLETEEEKTKEVFAFYGFAMHLAQVLEQQSINMVVIHQQFNKKLVTSEEVEALWNKYDFGKNTFGGLIIEINKLYNLSPEDSDELQEVLKLRNYMTHDYFRFNADLFPSDSGMKRTIKDFYGFKQRASSLDKKLNSYLQVYNEKAGITEEKLQQTLDSFKKEWQSKIINDDHDTFIKI